MAQKTRDQREQLADGKQKHYALRPKGQRLPWVSRAPAGNDSITNRASIAIYVPPPERFYLKERAHHRPHITLPYHCRQNRQDYVKGNIQDLRNEIRYKEDWTTRSGPRIDLKNALKPFNRAKAANVIMLPIVKLMVNFAGLKRSYHSHSSENVLLADPQNKQSQKRLWPRQTASTLPSSFRTYSLPNTRKPNTSVTFAPTFFARERRPVDSRSPPLSSDPRMVLIQEFRIDFEVCHEANSIGLLVPSFDLDTTGQNSLSAFF